MLVDGQSPCLSAPKAIFTVGETTTLAAISQGRPSERGCERGWSAVRMGSGMKDESWGIPGAGEKGADPTEHKRPLEFGEVFGLSRPLSAAEKT